MPWSSFLSSDAPATVVKEFRWSDLAVGGEFQEEVASSPEPTKPTPISLGDDFKLHEGHHESLGLKKKEEESIQRKVEELVEQRLAEIKQAAYEQAYAEGLTAGQEEAKRLLREEWAETLDAFQSALQQMAEEIHQISILHEGELVRLLIRIIKSVLPGWSEGHPESLVPLVKEAVLALAEAEHIVVRLHPRLLALLQHFEVLKDWPESLQQKIQWQADESVALSTIQLKSEIGEIDNSLSVRLSSLESEMREILPKAS